MYKTVKQTGRCVSTNGEMLVSRAASAMWPEPVPIFSQALSAFSFLKGDRKEDRDVHFGFTAGIHVAVAVAPAGTTGCARTTDLAYADRASPAEPIVGRPRLIHRDRFAITSRK